MRIFHQSSLSLLIPHCCLYEPPPRKSFSALPNLPRACLPIGARVDERFFGKPSASFCFQLFIAISWLLQPLIRSIMAIVLELSGKSLQVEEGTLPRIQQRPPLNRKAARDCNQIGDSSGAASKAGFRKTS